MTIQSSLASVLTKARHSRAIEPMKRLLRTVGLLDHVKTAYTAANDKLILRSGEYPVSIGDTDTVFHADSHIELERLRSMTERDVLGTVLSDLRSNDVFYDIGANVGMYSCIVGNQLPDDSVYAFEPHPANIARLRENLELNGVRARVFQKALSDNQGEVTLSVAVESHTTAPGHNLLELTDSIEAYGEGSAEKETVETVPGDTFVADADVAAPTVLKIDVEGAEYNVLKGFEETLASDDCRLVYCEVHLDHLPKFDASESELLELLESSGFEIETIDDRGDKYHLRAMK